jgi:molybdate transport system substrate-binding protein
MYEHHMRAGMAERSRRHLNKTTYNKRNTMFFRHAGWLLCAAALVESCGAPRLSESAPKLTVAAAANLMDVFGEIGPAFKDQKGIEVVFSYGATSELAQQIENGAPFDVFAAADTEHVDSLVVRQKLTADSQAIYAKGQLALWIPAGEPTGSHDLKELTAPKIHFIAVAQPKLAPYGQAAVEAMTNAHLWDALQPKMVYANSISMAKQLAASGNADATFTAYSLVLHERGTVLKVAPDLYHPIEQALAIVASTSHIEEAKQFRSFLLGPAGRAILAKSGYLLP